MIAFLFKKIWKFNLSPINSPEASPTLNIPRTLMPEQFDWEMRNFVQHFSMAKAGSTIWCGYWARCRMIHDLEN